MLNEEEILKCNRDRMYNEGRGEGSERVCSLPWSFCVMSRLRSLRRLSFFFFIPNKLLTPCRKLSRVTGRANRPPARSQVNTNNYKTPVFKKTTVLKVVEPSVISSSFCRLFSSERSSSTPVSSATLRKT